MRRGGQVEQSRGEGVAYIFNRPTDGVVTSKLGPREAGQLGDERTGGRSTAHPHGTTVGFHKDLLASDERYAPAHGSMGGAPMADEKDKERERKNREHREREEREQEVREEPNGGLLPLTHEQIQKLKKKA